MANDVEQFYSQACRQGCSRPLHIYTRCIEACARNGVGLTEVERAEWYQWGTGKVGERQRDAKRLPSHRECYARRQEPRPESWIQ
eukprot:787774-Pyramimonas_sp.AAC.1